MSIQYIFFHSLYSKNDYNKKTCIIPFLKSLKTMGNDKCFLYLNIIFNFKLSYVNQLSILTPVGPFIKSSLSPVSPSSVISL